MLAVRDDLAPRHLGTLRTLRRDSIRRLDLLHAKFLPRLCAPLQPAINADVVQPLLPLFVAENLQQPSPLLRLFATWSSIPGMHPFFSTVPRAVLPELFALLGHHAVKPVCALVVLEIADKLLPSQDVLAWRRKGDDDRHAEELAEAAVSEHVLQPHVGVLLENFLAYIFQKQEKQLATPPGPKQKRGPKLALKQSEVAEEQEDADESKEDQDDQEDQEDQEGGAEGQVEEEEQEEQQEEENTSSEHVGSDAHGKQRLTLTPLELSILSRIAPHLTEAEQSYKVVDMLVPHIASPNRIVGEGSKMNILRILLHSVSRFGRLQPHYNLLASQLEYSSAAHVKLLVCEVLVAGSAHEGEALQYAARVAQELNAIDGTAAGDAPDYDVCIAAFKALNDTTLDFEHVAPIHHSAAYMLLHDDYSLRNMAVAFFEHAIDQLASCDSEADSSERAYVQTMLLPSLKRGLRSNDVGSRVETIRLVARACRRLPHMHASLRELAQLTHEEDDMDFFHNISHLQRARQVKALQRLMHNLASGTLVLCEDTVSGFLLPLCINFIYEKTKNQDSNLINHAIDTSGHLARLLTWPQYSRLLMRHMGQATRRPQITKTLLRLVIAILDNFPFSLATTSSTTSTAEDGMDQAEDQEDAASAEARLDDHQRAIHVSMVRIVIPRLERFLTFKEDDEIRLRPYVALALVRLLMHMTQSTLNKHLPRLILKLANVLRHRHVTIRDETRNAVVSIASFLGPKHLFVVLDTLRVALARGYQRHVFSYTVLAILEALADKVAPGDYDSSCHLIVGVVMEELFGEVSEEKETDEIPNKIKEAKKMCAYDTALRLAGGVTPFHADILLERVKDCMATTASAKVTRKLEELLRVYSKGLQRNTALTLRHMLNLAYGCIAENTALSRKGAVKPKGSKRRPDSIYVLEQAKPQKTTPEVLYCTNAHILVSFGLELLHAELKRKRVDASDAEHLGMLDPFAPQLVNGLFSKHNSVIARSARIWPYFVEWHESLPSMTKATVIPKLLSRLIKLMQRSGEELVQTLVKALVVLLRHVSGIVVATPTVGVLLSFVKEKLDSERLQPSAFALLKVIVTNRYLHEDIYDLMSHVEQLLVQSQADAARAHAQQVCVRACHVCFAFLCLLLALLLSLLPWPFDLQV